MNSIQSSMYERALKFREDHTADPGDYEEFKAAVAKGFAYSFWCGNADCERKIKEETKATLRCIPLENQGGEGSCICCSQPSSQKAYFAKAY